MFVHITKIFEDKNGIQLKNLAHLDIGVLGFDGRNMGGAKILRVPENVEFAIGGRWRSRGIIVNSEGENEMKLNIWVDRDIREFDILKLSSYVFSKYA